MGGVLEVRAFLGLAKLFGERGWPNPRLHPVDTELTGNVLLDALDIPRREVEALIVNHRTVPVERAVLRPGDRVALVPPSVPGPHRVLLGLRRASPSDK
jgi:hypothetical protein